MRQNTVDRNEAQLRREGMMCHKHMKVIRGFERSFYGEGGGAIPKCQDCIQEDCDKINRRRKTL